MMEQLTVTKVKSSSSSTSSLYEDIPAERYVDAFPALNGLQHSCESVSSNTSLHELPWVANVRNSKKSSATNSCAPFSTVTQVFTIPLDERKFRGDKDYGGDNEKVVQDIVRAFPDVSIEVASSRDRSLTVVVSGRAASVNKAKASVLARLQTQTSIQMNVPREHHSTILGKQGARLREIEALCSAKIHMPRPEDNSDCVRISGTKESIEKARHELQVISDELSKLAFERLHIQKIYHPFIRGPFDRKLKELREQTGARINVPPYSVLKDEITVAGEKEAVALAVRLIQQIFEDKKRATCVVSVEVTKAQHKYIIGPKGAGLSQILESTGVSVEVPHTESSSESIILRGEASKLGLALTEVYSKANSQQQLRVDAPAWLHRFVIGKGGQKLSQITQGREKIHISFNEEDDTITVEGPSDDVVLVHDELKTLVDGMLSRMCMLEVQIDPRYHKHIIGKAGTNIKRIKEETGCQIRIPAEDGNNDVIRIEGPPLCVEKVRDELLALASKLNNEKTKDVIIDQRLHRMLIGQQGCNISKIRESFPEVQIRFPDSNQSSDIVSLRGPRDQVNGADKMLVKLLNKLAESNFEMEIKVGKQFHKNVIGKGGSTIRKIKDDTSTRIQLPEEAANSDIIKVIGHRKDVEEAVRRIEAIQHELVNISEVELHIPHRLHTAVIGSKGRLIQQIQKQCGNVQVRFPGPDIVSDVVLIRGACKSDVEKANRLLCELAKEKEEASFELNMRINVNYYLFLIGRRGANVVEQLRKQTKARIIFPEHQEADVLEDKKAIIIVGRREAVEATEKILLERIRVFEDIVEKEVTVDRKWYQHFMQRRGVLLNNLSEEFGGLAIAFHKGEDKVRMKGSSECVAGAVKRLLEMVDDLEHQVTIEVSVVRKYHKLLIVRHATDVQTICTNFNVQIKFPAVSALPESVVKSNGHNVTGERAVVSLKDLPADETASDVYSISISGRSEKCELAKAALLALIPLTEELLVPVQYHRLLIGAKGSNIRQYNDRFNVQMKIPSEGESDRVLLTGTRENLMLATSELKQQLAKWEGERIAREARNYQVKAFVPWIYHRQIIGPRGSGIQKIKSRYADAVLRIDIPPPEMKCDEMTVTGYREQADACAAELERMGRLLATSVTAELFVHNSVHPRLIGKAGRNLARLCDQLQVDIKIPTREVEGEQANLIHVVGQPDKVDDACDFIVNMASEWFDDLRFQGHLDLERGLSNGVSKQTTPSATAAVLNSDEPNNNHNNNKVQRKNHSSNTNPTSGFKVMDAPWDASSSEHFPSINGTSGGGDSRAAKVTSAGFKWGARHY